MSKRCGGIGGRWGLDLTGWAEWQQHCPLDWESPEGSSNLSCKPTLNSSGPLSNSPTDSCPSPQHRGLMRINLRQHRRQRPIPRRWRWCAPPPEAPGCNIVVILKGKFGQVLESRAQNAYRGIQVVSRHSHRQDRKTTRYYTGRIQEFLKGGGGVNVPEKRRPYRNFQTDKHKNCEGVTPWPPSRIRHCYRFANRESTGHRADCIAERQKDLEPLLGFKTFFVWRIVPS